MTFIDLSGISCERHVTWQTKKFTYISTRLAIISTFSDMRDENNEKDLYSSFVAVQAFYWICFLYSYVYTYNVITRYVCSNSSLIVRFYSNGHFIGGAENHVSMPNRVRDIYWWNFSPKFLVPSFLPKYPSIDES